MKVRAGHEGQPFTASSFQSVHRTLGYTWNLLGCCRRLTFGPVSCPISQIADFGLSNLYRGDEYLQTFCGSPLYASPEIVNGRPYRGPEVDTWSLGVLLYTMVHGTMPFDGQNHRTLVQQISTGSYRKPNRPSGEPRAIAAIPEVLLSFLDRTCAVLIGAGLSLSQMRAG